MKKLILLIPLLIGCSYPPGTTVIPVKNEVTQTIYVHKGKPITCIGRAREQLSCDWITYHKP